MTRHSIASLLVTTAVAMGLVLLTSPAEARRIDLGLGGGVLASVEEDLPVKDSYYAGIFSAIELQDKLDLELSLARADGRDNSGGPFRSIYHATVGLRLYLKTRPENPVRFYLSGGGSAFFDLKPDDNVTLGGYLGPGVRMKAGEHSGVDLRVPLVISAEGNTNTVIIPTLSWFYEF